eukprot:TRINITY_DN4936_c0_g1_i7.p1 TRINITY_DN4936_c0_g1~~TRINITY_DN4936_c0_g1_i7.p1  ORF type:complete len:746 (-),score=169.34 TRINITY_DN4936_c0_g1_i7:29-2266(-)
MCIRDRIATEQVQVAPRIINAEISPARRLEIYTAGGSVFVTPRVLLLDLLRKHVPIPRIRGIIVADAHKVGENSVMAFALRVFREQTRQAFIKAISDVPYAFSRGFGTVNKVMKWLHVQKLYLWPRFRSEVAEELEAIPPEVIELYQDLTAPMEQIQSSLVECMSLCLSELRKANMKVDVAGFSLENALSHNFDHLVRGPVENVKVTARVRQIVQDLGTLRKLLGQLLQSDCVTFYKMLVNIRAAHRPSAGTGWSWLVLDPARIVFKLAQLRVVGTKLCPALKLLSCEQVFGFKTGSMSLEQAPKWALLSQVLAESREQGLWDSPVLVVAHDDTCCSQLKEFLTMGGKATMRSIFEDRKQAYHKDDLPAHKKQKRELALAGAAAEGENVATQTTVLSPDEQLMVVPSCVRSSMLHELASRVVVLFDAHPRVIRMLEVYNALVAHQSALRVYFLLYERSVEKQQYISLLRSEKNAFQKLIQTKATMMVPSNQSGRVSHVREAVAAEELTSSRSGGRAVSQQIVVDVRELRSSLPCLLHRDKVLLHPVTLTVGDYVLSDQLVVERKSIPDLFSSMASGRLYTQVESMTRHYQQVAVLIEFDPEKPFTLFQGEPQTLEISANAMSSKLVLLALHFSNLRFFWSRGPAATASLFRKLKASQAQPNPGLALQVGSGKGDEDKQNPGLELLRSLPGITPVSYTHLRAHETPEHLVCRLLLEKKKKKSEKHKNIVSRREGNIKHEHTDAKQQ